MSLRDRLKEKKKEHTKQVEAQKQETTKNKTDNLSVMKEKLSFLLHKKISSTPKWNDYNETKQEQLASDFIMEQIEIEYPLFKPNPGVISRLIEDIIFTIKDFGVFESLLKDKDINYIMINGIDSVYVEKNNQLLKIDYSFKSSKELRKFADNLASSANLTVNEKNPILDFSHRRGYHVNIMVPPVSNTCITIKKVNANLCNLDDLLKQKALSMEMLKLFETAVLSNANIVVTGKEESGKTTILNGLCKKISTKTRAILIEDVKELNIDQDNIVRLKTQPLNDMKDVYQITTSNLIKNSIRMRPDRIVVGECKGDEAYDLTNLAKTEYLGFMTTVCADSPTDALDKLEKMILNCSKLPTSLIREKISKSIDLIIHVNRMSNGERKITKVSELDGVEEGMIILRDIFVWQKQEEEKVLLDHVSTGVVPHFLIKAKEKGYDINSIIFDKRYMHTYPEE